MANNSKEKTIQTNPRTYLINSVQLTDIMKYLMSKPYAEVVKLMNMLATLNQLDPSIGADFVKKQNAEVSDGKK
ncbi:MAG: hypothetical protein H8D92_00540 [Pelagibacteraceae bacterium]|nr:hypothetical protein [Pelagibacteraceae bacterium]